MWFSYSLHVWDSVKQNEPTKLTAWWNHHQALWNKRYLEVFEYHLFYDEFEPKSTYGSNYLLRRINSECLNLQLLTHE